jgi:hypothetical protein
MATLQNIPPSYLYTQYADDDNLQAFVASYNSYTQSYLDTFNGLNLPIYTQLSGALLDWVGAGVYGYPRPTLPGTKTTAVGPLDTYYLEQSVPLNTSKVTPGNVYVTTDDIYQRLLTWHFYKGDGKYCTVQWLKRRIARFLIGTNGTAPNIDNTYFVNLSFVGNRQITINIPASNPASLYLAAAISSGAAEMPFQYTYTVSAV